MKDYTIIAKGFFWKQLLKTSQNNLLAVTLQPIAPQALAKTKT